MTTYHPLTQDSGGTAEQRNQEAFDILVKMGLQNKTEEMTERESEFIEQISDRLSQFGEKCMVSPKQLFWLRDLKEKYL